MTIVVSGYASLDHAMVVDRPPAPDRTSLVTERLSAPWPAPGGAAHVALAVAGAGAPASLVSWVGDDADGRRFRQALLEQGVDCDALDASGTRSPSSYLFYDPEGGTTCCFDPGQVAAEPTARQRARCATADWWVLAVGPAGVTRMVLDELPDDRRLAWVVKADADAYPPRLVRRLLERVDVVTFSRAERRFLTTVTDESDPLRLLGPRALAIETRGTDPVWYRDPDGEATVPVEPVAARDTTGAGDTLAGACVASLAAGRDHDTAVRDGLSAVHRLLTDRARKERTP